MTDRADHHPPDNPASQHIVSPVDQQEQGQNIADVASPGSTMETSPPDDAALAALSSHSLAPFEPTAPIPPPAARLSRSETERPYVLSATVDGPPPTTMDNPPATEKPPLADIKPVPFFAGDAHAVESPKYFVSADQYPPQYAAVGEKGPAAPAYLLGAEDGDKYVVVHHAPGSLPALEGGPGAGERPRDRILGVRRKVFWLALILLGLVVVGAAIGGGIGGSLASRPPAAAEGTGVSDPAPTAPIPVAGSSASSPAAVDDSSRDDTSDASSPDAPNASASGSSSGGSSRTGSSSPDSSSDSGAQATSAGKNPASPTTSSKAAAAATTTAKTSKAAAATTTAAGPSGIPTLPIQAQAPGAKFSLAFYEKASYAGRSTNANTAGNFKLPFTANAYLFVPNASGCCVRFCLKKASVGWRCLETHQDSASSAIDQIAIACSGEAPAESACEKK